MTDSTAGRATLPEAVDASVMADESFVLPTTADIKKRYEKEAKARTEKMLAKITERAKESITARVPNRTRTYVSPCNT